MAVKEFLRSVREQDRLLRAYEQELEDLRRRAYNISSPKLGDKIQSNHLATLDEIVDKLDSQIEKVNAARDELIDKRDNAKALIDKVEDKSARCVLYRYYILIQAWEQIAVEMNYTIRWVYKLHGKALQDLEKEFTKIHYNSL
jgi:phage-related minor tail protein